MPQLGETVAEGKITKWFKSAGDAVKPGDNLFEIETDKVSMEVPSTTAGVLAEIRVAGGRGGAGRRRRGGDRRQARRRRRARPQLRASAVRSPPRKRPQPHPLPATPARPRPAPPPSAVRSIRSSRCARPRAITGRRGLRAAPSSRRWRGGSRRRPASISARVNGSGPHGRIVARDVEARARRQRAAPAAAAARGRPARRADQGALPRRAVRGSAARRHAQDHRRAARCRRSRPSRTST